MGRDVLELDADEMQAVVKAAPSAPRGQIGGIIKMIGDGRECRTSSPRWRRCPRRSDRASFATISLGLRQCVSDPEHNPMDVAAMEGSSSPSP